MIVVKLIDLKGFRATNRARSEELGCFHLRVECLWRHKGIAPKEPLKL